MGETQGALPLDPAKGFSTLWTPFRAIALCALSCYARVFIGKARARSALFRIRAKGREVPCLRELPRPIAHLS